MLSVLEHLAADYPQLYLNPDTEEQESYKQVVLRGEEPARKSLAHYRGNAGDREETVDTPAGPARVITLGNRQDFELVMRSLMAAKDGPLKPVPESQGAAMVKVFNWPRINAYVARYPEAEQAAAFKRFTSDPANYVDLLVVLSRGPYSHVDAAAAGLDTEEWIALSDTIRRYHELTHVICRRTMPGDVDPIRDELVADAVGLYAAFGRFDPEMENLFLGLRDGKYTGGRLENYTARPEELAGAVSAALARIQAVTADRAGAEPFDLIPALTEAVGRIPEAGPENSGKG